MIRPTDLRGILQYIPQFRDRVFVLAVDGAAVGCENFSNLLLDIAVLRSLSIRVVLVHGTSAQIRVLAREQGITPSDLDGTGVTDADTLRMALSASSLLTQKILEGLAANDLRAACPNGVIAHPMGILRGIDHLHTGKVERVDVNFLQGLLDDGVIPVLPPLGFDGEGKTYRVNSDGVAAAVASALKAIKLVFVTTEDGLRFKNQMIRQMLVAELEKLVNTQREGFAKETVSKAVHAVAACKAGVRRVHIINGRVDEGLLAEVFSNEGIGTLIYANEYQQIRPAKKKDIRNILHLTKPSVTSEELIKRTRATLERELGDYYIFETDKNPVACVALHADQETAKAEIACLYVSSSHSNQGIGAKLLQFVTQKARERGMREVFALSTQAFTFFQSKGGFQEGTVEDLPPSRRQQYEQDGRKSKILVKRLA